MAPDSHRRQVGRMSGFRPISSKRVAWLASTALAATLAGTAAQGPGATRSPRTREVNNPANWNPAAVPTGTAFFGTSSVTALSFTGPFTSQTIGGFTLNSGASAY